MPTDWSFVAEDADADLDTSPSVDREARADAVLIHGSAADDPWSNLATRIRFSEVDPLPEIESVRAWFGARSVTEFRWLLGPSTTPADLPRSLAMAGARPDENEPALIAMVLTHAPPRVAGVAVREIRDLPGFEAMERIYREVFGASAGPSAPAEQRWADFQARPGSRAFLAELDGEAVAYGVMRSTEPGPVLLAGGVTSPRARGRGAYRALVRARWDAARDSGAPALVTQAQAASRPILERLGFRSTGTIPVLVDAGR
jgi:GNAT superfamily N-acetyltransferase